MNRRDVLLGGSMVVAAGAAAALTPRKRLVLLGDRKLDAVIPKKIDDWNYVPSDAFVLPKSPGSLADRLYSQTLTRLYTSPTQPPIMLVIAYGAVQNDLLQLHRPETCYAAVGYTISSSRTSKVELAPAALLPVRELQAQSEMRVEQICYWTRIGDDLPTDGREQRRVKLQQQMRGYLSDGILVRISTVGDQSPVFVDALTNFAARMVQSMQPEDRMVLVGRPLAAAMKP
nr:exosortase-associated protein EpsI, V-type [Polymorphobacter sp.]